MNGKATFDSSIERPRSKFGEIELRVPNPTGRPYGIASLSGVYGTNKNLSLVVGHDKQKATIAEQPSLVPSGPHHSCLINNLGGFKSSSVETIIVVVSLVTISMVSFACVEKKKAKSVHQNSMGLNDWIPFSGRSGEAEIPKNVLTETTNRNQETQGSTTMRTLIRRTADPRIRASSLYRSSSRAFFGLLWLCCWLSTLQTASAQTDGSDLLPELVVDGFVDVEFCYAALDTADLNEDDEISIEEYVVFIQSLGPDGFVSFASQFSELPLVLTSNYNILACLCKRESLDDACCIGQNSHLEASGSKPDQEPTAAESSYLFLICSLSSIAIDRVLDSKAPTEAPTSDHPSQFPTMFPSTTPSTSAPSTFPSMGPTMSPTERGATRSPTSTPTTSSPTVDPVKEIVVKAIYQIGIYEGTVNNAYQDDLVSAMNFLLESDLSPDSEPGRRRKLLRSSRDLQTPSLPSNINGVIPISKYNVIGFATYSRSAWALWTSFSCDVLFFSFSLSCE
jgi:hypothetical protein